MNNDTFSSVYDLSVELANCISIEEYEKATQIALLLDEKVRGLDRSVLLDLSDDKISFLQDLVRWLSDQDGTLRKRSKELIDIIAPLNERSMLNHRNKY